MVHQPGYWLWNRTMNDEILQSIAEGALLKGHQSEVREYLEKHPRSIVILDDDPTGTQTVQNIPVVTNWSEQTLEKELLQSPVFFVLTNSRALQKKEAEELAATLGRRLKLLADKHGKKLIVISRSDSTLRGHYPGEVETLAKGLGMKEAKHALIPAFFEGGRYTYQDVHYVREGDEFIPAADTPFAKDNSFGYAHSNLRDYVLEKYGGGLHPDSISTVPIEALRTNGTTDEFKSHCTVVNATSHADLEAFALAALKSGENLVYRTAASFVNAISGQRPAPLLEKEDFQSAHQTGALVVIGSYVPKTTAQLKILKSKYPAEYMELDVDSIFEDDNLQQTLLKKAAVIDGLLRNGSNVVLYTSRRVKQGRSTEESLQIVNVVSRALTTLLGMVTVQPKFILAKGGITSSDVAVKSLKIQRATVLGQLIKGVPVWKADENAKFPAIPYIVFPGNVGTAADLYNALKKLE